MKEKALSLVKEVETSFADMSRFVAIEQSFLSSFTNLKALLTARSFCASGWCQTSR